jgi:hypothetical protein
MRGSMFGSMRATMIEDVSAISASSPLLTG